MGSTPSGAGLGAGPSPGTLGRMNDVPPELRGVSPDPVRESALPAWVRVTALVLIVAMFAWAIYAAF